MKLGIFTDSHYSSQEITCGKRYNSKSLIKIKEAVKHFKNENCEYIICLGDLIDKEKSHEKETENLKKISAVIKDSALPWICIMGNHDGFAFEKDEFYGILGLNEPDVIIKDNKKLVFIDACYFKSGEHYHRGDSGWEDTCYPYEDSLKESLKENKETFIFIHQNIDPNVPENHRLYNSDKIIDIIEKSGNVKTVFQGHYHEGAKSEINNIRYVTFPAMCERDDSYFVIEI